MKRHLSEWGVIYAVLFIVVLLASAMAFFTYRDQAAVDRCTNLGGQTWDDGAHCVLGNPEVVSTR